MKTKHTPGPLAMGTDCDSKDLVITNENTIVASVYVSTTVPAEGTTGITVLYGNTNIFFPILREVCDLRIYMVLCL